MKIEEKFHYYVQKNFQKNIYIYIIYRTAKIESLFPDGWLSVRHHLQNLDIK